MASPASASESGKPEKANKYSSVNVADIGKHFFASASASCIGQGAAHPIDVVKVRLQLEHVGQRTSSSGMMKKLLHIVRHEGLRSLYQGLMPALWRSCVYGCLRLGLYEPCKDALDWAFDSSNLLSKLGAGVLSGATATIASNPLDVLKVRLQAQHQPLRGALVRELRNMVAIEGFAGLWRGVGPSTARASVLTASQLATYDESKKMIRHWLEMEEGLWMQISASVAAGVIGTTVTAPIDTVKIRMMIQREMSGGLYRNGFDCAYKIWSSEGLLGLFKGWSALFAKLGPQTAIMLLAYEKIRQLAGMKAL